MNFENSGDFYFYDALQRRQLRDAENRARTLGLNPSAFKDRERLARGNSPAALQQARADNQAYWRRMREVEAEANQNILADARRKKQQEEELRQYEMRRLRDEEEARKLTLAKARAAMMEM